MYIYEIGVLTHFKKINEMDRGVKWRENLDEWCAARDIKTFNPAIDFLKEVNHTYFDKMIVDQNEYYINKCDIAIVNMDCLDYSPGSIYELTRFKMLGKPVIAFGEYHWSPHINCCISQYCNDLDEVKSLLENMFNVKRPRFIMKNTQVDYYAE